MQRADWPNTDVATSSEVKKFHLLMCAHITLDRLCIHRNTHARAPQYESRTDFGPSAPLRNTVAAVSFGGWTSDEASVRPGSQLTAL